MITQEYLEKIGFEVDDIDFILKYNEKHIDDIEPFVNEYISGIKIKPLVPYEGNERALSYEKSKLFIKKVQEKIPDENGYTSALVAWLNCVPHLHEFYKSLHLSENVFYESMKDFSYKLKECKNVYGVCGLFADWFFAFFDLKLFSLGRLQFEVAGFEYDKYTYGDIHLKKGDMVYYCHIPSSGKLTCDMCMDSFQKAYEFFKPNILGDVIPIICSTWLFYKPYLENVFPKNSNIQQFAKLFDIIDTSSSGNDFSGCWRIFNKMYEGTTEGLPADNTLRRNFIEYINGGGDFGKGYGIALYDGKARKIINCKS